MDWERHIKARIPICGEWSGCAKVLGEFAVPGRPTNLNNSRERAYFARRRC